jgi:hypothetical protein
MNRKTSSPRLFQAGSKSQAQPIAAGGPGRRRMLFGQPPLLEGESGAAYEELFARIWAAVKPADIIEEMFTVDIVSLEWEILRWRRLKSSRIRKRALEKLAAFLREELDYNLYRDCFVDDLVEILEENLPQDQVDNAQTLARQCARNERDAVDKVHKILDGAGLHMDNLLDRARARRVKELVKEYAQYESETIKLINELLSGAGESIDVLMAEALGSTLEYVERVDRLTTIAEGRRNASLREIDRRRPILAETLRNTVQQIEHDDLQVIETRPAEGEMRRDE